MSIKTNELEQEVKKRCRVARKFWHHLDDNQKGEASARTRKMIDKLDEVLDNEPDRHQHPKTQRGAHQA